MTTTTKRRGFTHSSQFSRVDDRTLEPFPTPCPEWCQVASGGGRRAFHLDYEASGGLPQERIHEGPTFGAVAIEAVERLDSPGTYLICPRVNAGAGHVDLRQLAADALVAADWIEANR